jgi:uncharacterized membrane-anchored protein
MNRSLRLVLLGLVIVAQIAVPVQLMRQEETTLRFGTRYKLKTAPVDPYDAFRGRYIALTFKEEQPFSAIRPSGGKNGNSVYVILEEGDDGFARISKLSSALPKDGLAFRSEYRSANMSDFAVVFPFRRFYMDEENAPQAETAYRNHSRRDNIQAYATIRVYNGHASLEQLYIEDQPIRDFLNNSNSRSR